MRRRKFNKVISLLLVIVTVISLNITVFAEGTDNVNVNNTSTEVIDTEEKTEDTVVEDKTDETDTINETDVPDTDVKTEDNSNIETDKNVEDNNTVTEEKNDVSKVEVKTKKKSVAKATTESETVEPVAIMNDVGYETLQAAIDVAPINTQRTITLQKDIQEDVVVAEDKKIIINLNKCTITNISSHTIHNYGDLTINGAGTVDNITHQKAALYNDFNARAVINGGKYYRTKENGQNNSNEGNSYYTIVNRGTMTINGSAVKVCQGEDMEGCFSTLVENGCVNQENSNLKPENANIPTLKVVKGTFTGGLNNIHNGDYGVLEISGGAFEKSSQNAILNDNKVTITGGTFSGKDNVINNSNYQQEPHVCEVTISGGKFTGKINKGNIMTITGGNFSVEIPEGCLPKGFVAEINEEGTYDVLEYVAEVITNDASKLYTSLSQAYEEVQIGSTIKVIKDTIWSGTETKIIISKNVTLDLNGHIVKIVRGTVGAYLSLEKPDVYLTIKDSSESGNGELTSTNSSYLISLTGGNLKLESGVLKTSNASRIVSLNSKDSTFEMTGGKISSGKNRSATKDYIANIGIQANGGRVTINDGIIESTYSKANKAYGIRADGGNVIVNGGTFNTGAVSSINIAKADLVNISKVNNASIKTTANTIVTIGEDNLDNLVIPKLEIDSNGIVHIKNNVFVEQVDVIADSQNNKDKSYTFNKENEFGGKYGNDFSENIIGMGKGYKCQQENNYYVVVPHSLKDDNDPLAVAKITNSDNNTTYYGEIRQAFSALQNGGKLTLLKDINYIGDVVIKSTAMNVTVDLNGHNIIAKNSPQGISIGNKDVTPASSDCISIIGTGIIEGKNYGIGIHSSLRQIDSTVSLVGKTGMVQLLNHGSLLINDNIPKDKCNGLFQTTIDGNDYLFLRFDAAANYTTSNSIDLIADYTCSINYTLTNSSVIEFDLNNHKFTSSAQIAILSNGEGLSIKNGTIESTYKYQSPHGYIIGTDANGQNGSKLIFENVNIYNTKSGSVTAITVNGNIGNAEVSLINCTIQSNYSGTNDNSVGIYFPVKGGTLDIVDTTIKAANALQVKGGTVTIKGSSVITSTGEKGEFDPNSGGCSNTGDAIYVEDNYGYNPTVIIESGTIKSEGTDTHALNLHKVESVDKPATGSIVVSGGSFSEIVDEKYCAEKYIPVTVPDENGNYTVITDPKMYGCTLSLDGTIGVNFYVDMNNVDNMSNYSMKFTVAGQEMSRVNFDENAHRTFNGKVYYRFTCPVLATQMTDTIVATLMKGDTAVSNEYTYSVKKYCDNQLKNSNDEKLKNLLKAMLNYGGYAQKEFNYNTGNLANNGIYLSNEDPINGVTIDNLSQYKMATSGNLPEDIQNIGATLSLQSDTIMRFYIYLNKDADITKYTFTVNGKTYIPISNSTNNSVSNAEYYIELEGINSRKLNKMYTLSVGDYSVSYSALSYVYNKLGETDTDLVNVVKALYLYSEAARVYTGWLTD